MNSRPSDSRCTHISFKSNSTLAAFVLLATSQLMACSGGDELVPATGGVSSGGGVNGGGSSGGAGSGGTLAGSGGAVSSGGRAAAGGRFASGGAAAGGAAAGGAAVGGGSASGGAPAGGSASGGSASGGGGNDAPTFAEIAAIVELRCAGAKCHDAAMPEKNILLVNDGNLFSTLTTKGAPPCQNAKYVVPGDSAGSALVQLIVGTQCKERGMNFKMPEMDSVTSEELQMIKDWIDAGAAM
jgi:hypothetical protein